MIKTFNAIIDMELPANEKSLLLTILRHVNHTTGECYPSVETLMQKSGIKSKSTFLKVRKNLVEKGLLQYNQKGTKLFYMITLSSTKSNQYKIDTELVQNLNRTGTDFIENQSTVGLQTEYKTENKQNILLTESNPYFDYLNGGWMFELSSDMIN